MKPIFARGWPWILRPRSRLARCPRPLADDVRRGDHRVGRRLGRPAAEGAQSPSRACTWRSRRSTASTTTARSPPSTRASRRAARIRTACTSRSAAATRCASRWCSRTRPSTTTLATCSSATRPTSALIDSQAHHPHPEHQPGRTSSATDPGDRAGGLRRGRGGALPRRAPRGQPRAHGAPQSGSRVPHPHAHRRGRCGAGSSHADGPRIASRMGARPAASSW